MVKKDRSDESYRLPTTKHVASILSDASPKILNHRSSLGIRDLVQIKYYLRLAFEDVSSTEMEWLNSRVSRLSGLIGNTALDVN
jgi:hypothetical protein